MAVSGVNSGGNNQNQNLFTKNNALGKNDFLNLMMTQLKYQDPLNPTDNQEFIAQMAQFSTLEIMQNMSEGFTKLNNLVEGTTHESQVSQAINLIGREVDIVDTETQETVTGLVSGMKFKDGIPLITVDGKDFSIGLVAAVREVGGTNE